MGCSKVIANIARDRRYRGSRAEPFVIRRSIEVTQVKVAVVKENAPGERRVALVPDSVSKLANAGLDVLVEEGAGEAAWFPDHAYAEAGAVIVTHDKLLDQADILLYVGKPAAEDVTRLKAGQTVMGMLQPLAQPELPRELAKAGVTAISLDGIPRTVPRAQTMDALTSQANVAGYKAAIVAAGTFGRFFPLLITAAGTARPAEVLVLGAGVAGLQAIGTARRLGAVVSGYDVRPAAKGEVESLGARFLTVGAVADGDAAGGYARALTDEEQRAQQEELNAHIAKHDVVITTAQVPGRRPPLLVTGQAIKDMRPGSVIVDLGSSPLGGNVELSEPDQTIVTDNGITIIGAGNLPATVPTAASTAYARNLSTLLTYMVRDGKLVIDTGDEIHAGVVISHDGQVIHPAVAELLNPAVAAGGGTDEPEPSV
jgi:proton-translocating NAD(P)+ transhydrogenase subunit alpha